MSPLEEVIWLIQGCLRQRQPLTAMTRRVLQASLGRLDALRGVAQFEPEIEVLVQRARAALRQGDGLLR